MATPVPMRKQIHESFLREILLFTDPRKFSPSKVSRYTVCCILYSTKQIEV